MPHPSHPRTAIYPGTFDPVTWGHMDIIERASKLFDRLVVSVASNPEKQPLFPLNKRMEFLRKTLEKSSIQCAWEVVGFDGLLIDHARQMNAAAIVRGLRAVSDYDYEFQIASANQQLAPEIEGIFLMARDKYHFISSSLVKSIAQYKGDISNFVPDIVLKELSM